MATVLEPKTVAIGRLEPKSADILYRRLDSIVP